jgi:high-affinity nickel permease
MTFASTTFSNIFLACIALTNLVILAMVYRSTKDDNRAD